MVGAVVVLCGCVALSRLFEEKPKTIAGANGSPGSGSKPEVPENGAKPPDKRPPIVPVEVFNQYPYPTGTAVGSWVTLRITRPGKPPVDETWAAIGTEGDALWIEHTDCPLGKDLYWATCYLVAPDGALRRAVRGWPGETPVSLPVTSTAMSDLGILETFLAGTPTDRTENILVAAGSFPCKVVTLDEGEGTAWVADGVPFHGLVRILHGKEPERYIIELAAMGKDRTRSQLVGVLPTSK